MTTVPHRLPLGVAAAPALCQDDRRWNFQVSPYLWGSGVSGEVTPLAGGPTLESDSSLDEVLENLDGAFFLSAYGRDGRWVFLGDISASSCEGVVRPRIPAKGEISQRSITLAAGRRVQSDPRVTLDLLAGGSPRRRHLALLTPGARPRLGHGPGAGGRDFGARRPGRVLPPRTRRVSHAGGSGETRNAAAPERPGGHPLRTPPALWLNEPHRGHSPPGRTRPRGQGRSRHGRVSPRLVTKSPRRVGGERQQGWQPAAD